MLLYYLAECEVDAVMPVVKPKCVYDFDEDDEDEYILSPKEEARRWWCKLVDPSTAPPRPRQVRDVLAVIDQVVGSLLSGIVHFHVVMKQRSRTDHSVAGTGDSTVASLGTYFEDGSTWTDVSFSSVDSDDLVCSEDDDALMEQEDMRDSVAGRARMEYLTGHVTPDAELPGLDCNDDVPLVDEDDVMWKWVNGRLTLYCSVCCGFTCDKRRHW